MRAVPLAYASNDMWRPTSAPFDVTRPAAPPGPPRSDQLTTPQERKLITEQLAGLDQANVWNVERDEKCLADLPAHVGRAPMRGHQSIDHHLPRAQRARDHLEPVHGARPPLELLVPRVGEHRPVRPRREVERAVLRRQRGEREEARDAGVLVIDRGELAVLVKWELRPGADVGELEAALAPRLVDVRTDDLPRETLEDRVPLNLRDDRRAPVSCRQDRAER